VTPDKNDLYELLNKAHDILDDEGHDEECALRCLANECSVDHHCDECAEDGE
jgi:hypothetical protein